MSSIFATAVLAYKTQNYDEAIQYFSSLLQSQQKRTNQEKSLLNIWLGKCYFQKWEIFFHKPHISAVAREHEDDKAFSKPSDLSRRMSQKALTYFDTALSYDSTSSKAYYWKGKALKYERDIEQSYECFAKASTLSPTENHRRKCSSIFAKYPTLPFRETRAQNSLTLETALKSCSSSDAYARMEACQYLLKQSLTLKDITQIKPTISSLAGKRFLSCYIPFTGDADSRVKEAARSILCQLQKIQ